MSEDASVQDKREVTSTEPFRRVNFQVPESKHRKLKICAAKNNQSIKDFLTAYIDSLPDD